MTFLRVPIHYIPFSSNPSYPQRSTAGAAGYDIVSPISVTIEPGETVRIPLGWGCEVPRGYYLSLQTRSSLSIKHGIVLANGTEGVVDSDYKDEIVLALFNRSSEPFLVSEGDRVAQALFKRYERVLPVSDRLFSLFRRRSNRTGGLGSTGRQ